MVVVWREEKQHFKAKIINREILPRKIFLMKYKESEEYKMMLDIKSEQK